MQQIPDWVWEALAAAVAGAAGGLVRTLHSDKRSWRQFAVDVIAGSAMAVYMGPLIASLILPAATFVSMDSDQVDSLGGFLCGLCGVLIVELVMTRARKVLSKESDEQ